MIVMAMKVEVHLITISMQCMQRNNVDLVFYVFTIINEMIYIQYSLLGYS